METTAIQKVSFVGAGNVAFNLAPAFYNAGIQVRHIVSRNQTEAQKLAKLVNAVAADNLSEIDKSSDAVFFTLPDDAIAGSAKELFKNNDFKGVMVHTSGSTTLDDLVKINSKAGVFYPLQTFNKNNIIDFDEIPVCIEGVNEHITHVLECLARLISGDVRRISSAQRAVIHLGAVFASNFTNHLYARAFDILKRSAVNPSILLPLIRETASRLNRGEPVKVQTGPAVRGDVRIMNKHLGMLADDEAGAEIYRLLSEHIQLFKERKA
jgi:predicted short-subunit dehydrogenase-like oxidoreductase (DUF2520 family)